MPPQQEETTVDRAERLLLQDILNGTYPPNSFLPGERTLCKTLEVARPALREALQRLNHDGWLEIQQGKTTRVRDYMHDGTLNILMGLFKANPALLPDLVAEFLEVWGLFAPVYAGAAVRRAPGLVIDELVRCMQAGDDPQDYTAAMWSLHRTLISYSGNRVYGLMFNSFVAFYHQLAGFYYTDAEHRANARRFWEALEQATHAGEDRRASKLMAHFMRNTLTFWQSGAAEVYKQEVLASQDDSE